MRKKILLIFIGLLLVWAGLFRYCTTHSPQPSDEIWVKTTLVTTTSLKETAHAVGALVAPSIEITPELAGHIEKIYFKDGTFVKKGDVLMQLNNAVYKAKNASAQAKLILNANYFKRLDVLRKKDVIAEQTIDQAEANFKEAKALAEETEVMLSKMQLVAPFAGMVGKSKVNIGDYVTVGQPIVTLTDINHLRIDYSLPEKYLPFLKLNQTVTISSTAYPGKKFTGKLVFISPTINTDNRSISLYAELINENQLLKPGMFVDIEHDLEQKENVIMIPARSLIPILDGSQVFKIVDGKAYAVTVTTGIRNDNNIQITHGLAPADRLITDGQQKLKNGIPVKFNLEDTP